jgi:hypothetical protein
MASDLQNESARDKNSIPIDGKKIVNERIRFYLLFSIRSSEIVTIPRKFMEKLY